MSSFNCLITTVILIITYIIFTLNYPQYIIDNIDDCKTNYVIKFISLMSHIIFMFSNIYLLSINTSFEEFKKKVYIPCSILQITYLWISIYVLNNAKCTNYIHLTNYYSFVNSAFWMSAYGIYIKLGITQLFF
jgi:hypothetical protein